MSAQKLAAQKAAATKAKNATRTQARALINTPNLRDEEIGHAPAASAAHDVQHVHGARAPPNTAPLRQWVRFADLMRAGIVRNWTQLGRLIKEENFPPGRHLGAKSRAWTIAEVEQWLDSRPLAVERKSLCDALPGLSNR